MPQKLEITAKQEAILVAIGKSARDRGRTPTIRELGEATGIASTSVVNYHLRKLERAGFLCREPFISRGLMLTEAGAAWLAERGVYVLTTEQAQAAALEAVAS